MLTAILPVLAAVTHLIGWPSGAAVAQEINWERILSGVPSAANAAAIEAQLSSKPHRAGTPADYATAQFVERRLQADGFTTKRVEYDVEFTGPVTEQLAITSPVQQQLDLLEGDPLHHTMYEKTAGPPWDGNSGDGDVAGPLYYVNFGTAEDLATFDRMNVNLKGAIVLLRGGGGASYAELTKRGVIGVIHFTDPAADGYGTGEVWPRGNHKNINMAERAGGPNPSASPTPLPPGDLTLPGQAPLPGIPHNPWFSVPRPQIPELPITQRNAKRLLSLMSGELAPATWHPLFEIVQHIGGNVRVHLNVKMDRHLTRIWNILGELRGSEMPDSIVMLGSHRDAQVFGAIDPGSGTTTLLQVADSLHALQQQGWKPKRTIQIMSWDGHELGLYGSISYAYQYGPALRANVLQYINTDQVTTGPPFLIRSTTALWPFLKQIADVVQGPDGSPLSSHNTADNPLLQPPSSGSDHQTFAYELGIPVSSNGFRGDFGAHHTAEDNIPGIQTYDPGFKEAVSYAIFTGIQALRAADATDDPLRMSAHAQNLIDALAIDVPLLKSGVDVSALRAALATYLAAAKANDDALDAAENAGDAAAMQRLSAKEEAAFHAFYAPGGLSNYPYYHAIDRAPLGFPEIINAQNAADQQKAVDRFITYLAAATNSLR